MARNRVIYQSEGLYVGTTSGTAHNETLDNGKAGSVIRTGAKPAQLHRIQSINYGFDIPRQDVNQFGQLARIDQVILEQPTVDLDFSYYTETGFNDRQLGFYVGGTAGALSHFISGTIGEVSTSPTKYKVPGSNFYIRTDAEGADLNTSATDANKETVIGVGNVFVTNWTAEASVGSFPTTSITAEGLNMKFYDVGEGVGTSNGSVPSVKPTDGSVISTNFTLPPAKESQETSNGLMPSALRPGDISFEGVVTTSNKLWRGFDAGDLKIQSFSISADMSRENLEKLGSKFAYSKELEFPMTVTLSMEAIVGDSNADALSEIINTSDADYDIAVAIASPVKGSEWTNANGKQAIGYKVKGLKTDSMSISSSIGDNKSISLTATAQVGGPTDTENGLFIYASGVNMGTTP